MSRETPLQILRSLSEILGVSIVRYRASFGSDVGHGDEDACTWLKDRLAERRSLITEGENPLADQITLWGTSRGRLSWCLEVTPYSQSGRESEWYPDEQVLLYIDHSLADRNAALLALCNAVFTSALHDPAVVYGFIDHAPRSVASHPHAYSGFVSWEGWDWHGHIQQEVWASHTAEPGARVRGVHWGNIFGAQLASRIDAAGLSELIDWQVEECGVAPLVTRSQNGSMAVAVDAEPRTFARERVRGMMSMSPAVKSAGVLWATLAKAGLL